jgi:hypothetical protein
LKLIPFEPHHARLIRPHAAQAEEAEALARGVPGASDSSGNSVADTASVTWTVDSFAPSVTLTPRPALLPTPTGTTNVVESIDIAFSESVTGFSLTDLMLTRNGEPMSLVNARLTGSGSRFVLHGLDAVTASNGVYSLTIDPQAAAIADLAGNPMRSAGGLQWTQGGRDTTQPTVMLASRAPQIGANGQHTVVATFSEPVVGLTTQAISIVNGAITNLVGTGSQYTFTVTAIADGPVVVTVPAGATSDAASATGASGPETDSAAGAPATRDRQTASAAADPSRPGYRRQVMTRAPARGP